MIEIGKVLGSTELEMVGRAMEGGPGLQPSGSLPDKGFFGKIADPVAVRIFVRTTHAKATGADWCQSNLRPA